nr:MAG TPA: hypothetical protein [Caudoviricetes sp.]
MKLREQRDILNKQLFLSLNSDNIKINLFHTHTFYQIDTDDVSIFFFYGGPVLSLFCLQPKNEKYSHWLLGLCLQTIVFVVYLK